MKRRDILKSAGLALAGTTLLPFSALANTSTADEKEKNTKSKVGKRKLGSSLEVSSIGIGVQNMSRTYQTTIPNRKQMHQIILLMTMALLCLMLQKRMVCMKWNEF